MAKEFILKLNVIHVLHAVKVFGGKVLERMHGQCTIIPLHVPSILVELDSSFGKEIGAKYHVIPSIIIIEDKCFLLSNPSIFVKLKKADVMQSDHMLCHELAGQCLDGFVSEVLEVSSLG